MDKEVSINNVTINCVYFYINSKSNFIFHLICVTSAWDDKITKSNYLKVTWDTTDTAPEFVAQQLRFICKKKGLNLKDRKKLINKDNGSKKKTLNLPMSTLPVPFLTLSVSPDVAYRCFGSCLRGERALKTEDNNLILLIKWPQWLGGSGRVDEQGWASSTVSLSSTRRSHVQIEM